jgi:hypothetical protein
LSASDTSVVSWLEVTDHRIRDLLAVADDASSHQRRGGDSAVPASDEFRAAVLSLQQWTDQHPCPERALAGRFEVLLARYRFVSLVTRDEASLPDGARSAPAVNRLRILNADLRAFLDDLEEHQREQRCGEPLA